jgi:pyridinium-3,5-biscarboxylic acid mononucleotide sulfurtransferase
MTLEEFFKENRSVALGFSGGVDSSYLLWAARLHGADVRVYYAKSAFQPSFEMDDALDTAKHIGIEVKVLSADILASKDVAANPKNRCYHCKKIIFGALVAQARADGAKVIIDGTNASDDLGDRPGAAALAEMAVRSPLRECGLTKSDIRRLSKEAGLPNWDKPAYSCLATRVPFGREITPELLQKIEGAEATLFMLGFSGFRVRVFGEAAKLQVPLGQMKKIMWLREEIIKALRPFFGEILLDLDNRRIQ